MTVLSDRASEIARVLGFSDDPAILRRIERFCETNGYAGLLRAARYTAARPNIRDPWNFTIKAYNYNLARLSLLYSLCHWAETGLRSRVELAMSEARGDGWFLDVSAYLPGDRVPEFVRDRSQGTVWRMDGEEWVPNYTTGTEFLDSVNLGWLRQIVIHNYSDVLLGSFRRPTGEAAPVDELSRLVAEVNECRKKVAHNAYVDDAPFLGMLKSAKRLVTLLGFDLSVLLPRSEAARTAVVTKFASSLDHPNLA